MGGIRGRGVVNGERIRRSKAAAMGVLTGARGEASSGGGIDRGNGGRGGAQACEPGGVDGGGAASRGRERRNFAGVVEEVEEEREREAGFKFESRPSRRRGGEREWGVGAGRAGRAGELATWPGAAGSAGR
uniref:Uncharacterized protein n=1 Tax=Oryza sativa subsp. japonica TaxID=39947 RepID=Q84MG4_ORYSJ|nr:hypothetical protein Os03g30960 [Oryza sativa Japonica Group]